MNPLSVPNCSLIGARIRVLWRILQSVQQQQVEEEKNEEKNPQTLATRILEMDGAVFFNFGMWLPYLTGTFVAILVSIG